MKTRSTVSVSLSALLLTMPMPAPLARETETPAWPEMRNVPRGEIRELDYQSASLDQHRVALAYLPPGYESSSASYPVLYLLHGAGGDESSWTERQQANVMLDNLSAMQFANSPAWGGIDMDATLAANADAINELDMLWVGCGTEDTLFDVNRAFSERLSEAGVEHTFRVTLGGHTAAVWSRYLHEVAPQLF